MLATMRHNTERSPDYREQLDHFEKGNYHSCQPFYGWKRYRTEILWKQVGIGWFKLGTARKATAKL